MQTLVRDHIPPGPTPSERLSGTLPGRRPVAADELRAGSLLHGRYRLCERLGAGGFGVVWRAEDMQLHREVALKRIPCPHGDHARTAVIASAGGPGCAFDSDPGPRPGSDLGPGSDPGHGPGYGPGSGYGPGPEAAARERAGREALATARLAHPAIVALYEAFVDEDAFYLVSELVHGATLASLIAADALSDEEMLAIGLALTRALDHAHARGVIHRDIKPHNVLVPHDPGPHEAPAKLTDFGGARLAGEEALTRTGDTLGTLAYMAPEQSEGMEAGPAADLYSLALVLYEGLAGSNPVRGPTPAATARRIGRPLPPLATVRPDLPDGLTRAIDTALEIDPARRETLRELHDALEGALSLSGGLSPTSPARPTRVTSTLTRTLTRLAGPVYGADPAAGPAHIAGPAPIADSTARAGESAYPMAEAPSPVAAQKRVRILPVPRALWLGGTLAGMVWLIASGLPGAGLLLGAAVAAPLLAMGPRPGAGWIAAGLAPLLGLVGLAGAYPALAGQPRAWRTRATLGALGYWWLTLAAPLLVSVSASAHATGRSVGGARLWLGLPAGLPARAVWEGSLADAATHVVGPALSIGSLLGATLWALAAVALPWVVRGRGPLLDSIAAVAWSAATLAATPYVVGGLHALSGAAPLAQPRGLVAGAILAAAIAVAARALRGPVTASPRP